MANNNDSFGAIVKGILVLFALVSIFFAFVIFIAIGSNEESGWEMSGMEGDNQNDLDALTDVGKLYYEQNMKRIDEKVKEFGGSYGVHWVYLESILRQAKSDSKNDDSKCAATWVGPMRFKELNWVGRQFLKDHPGAKTDLTDCGDLDDKMRSSLQDIKTIQEYEKVVNEGCLQEQEEKQTEMFCRPYGLDANNDQKADPEDAEDSMLAAASLLQDYQHLFGNMGQALQHLYGEDEKFLRSVKNNILAWLKDPSDAGIFRWPLSEKVTENKKVSKKYQENGADFTIKSKEGETVYAVGTSEVVEVDQEQGCVTLLHFLSGENVSTTYCHLKEINVEKEDEVQIGDEIGTVGNESLVIKMTEVDEDDNPNNDPEVNPEQYLTPPAGVEFEEDQEN